MPEEANLARAPDRCSKGLRVEVGACSSGKSGLTNVGLRSSQKGYR
jgi:hypothetical protein